MNSKSLTEMPPGCLDHCLESLTSLEIYANALTKLEAGVIGGCKNLKLLNAFNNKIKKLPADIGGLGELEELNFAANQLMMTADNHFTELKKCKILNLYDNRLVRMGNLSPLANLEELRLSGNSLEEMPTIASMPNLTILEIHKNRIAEVPDDWFTKTPALQRLDIHANMLKTALPASLLQCKELVGLQVHENKDLPSLPDGDWPEGLEALFLQETKLTDLPSGLVNMQKLKRVNVDKLALSAEAKKLEAAMRKLTLDTEGGIFWTSSGERLEQAKGHK